MVLVTLRTESQSHAAFSADTLARRVSEALEADRFRGARWSQPGARANRKEPWPIPVPIDDPRPEDHAAKQRPHQIIEKLTFPEEVPGKRRRRSVSGAVELRRHNRLEPVPMPPDQERAENAHDERHW